MDASKKQREPVAFISDLQSWFEGNYAYWNAAAIAEDYDQATMENVIELFATENLSNAE